MTSALRRKAAQMASTAAAAVASGTGCYSQTSWALRRLGGGGTLASAATRRRNFSVSAAAGFDNQNREYVIVGGGNAAGYAARTFVEHGMAEGRLCIVSKEAVPPYERPALTKGYLFPPEKKPARLPGFHTCVGSGGQRQTAEWYKENGIEVLYEDPVEAFDGKTQTLKTSSGKILKYGSLIISTGCAAARLPEKIGGNLPGVHYIRDVADADSLVSSLGKSKKIVVIGGGYIGMEVAAAACGWNLDTTIIFPEDHIMPRLFTPSLAKKYEELYEQNGVKFVKGGLISKLDAGSDGRVSSAILKDGSVVEADTVIVGIGAKPSVSTPAPTPTPSSRRRRRRRQNPRPGRLLPARRGEGRSSSSRARSGRARGEAGDRTREMASEDVVGKSRGDTAVNTIVNLAEEAKLAREGVKGPGHQVLTICKSLFAGGVAGGLSRTAVAPLERLKILLQVQNPHSIKYNGTVQGLKYIWRTEGLRGLFKGNGTNCARIVPNSAVKFFSYEQASRGILYLYRQQTGDENAQLSPILRLGAGATAGIIAMSATYPMDMVRGRITVQTEKSPYQYRGMFHALGTVYREEGFRALYRGWLPSVIGVVPYVGLNFAVYESLKDWLLQSNAFDLAKDNELHVVTRLGCGAVAGTIGQTVAYPLDVVRRRMQMVGWSHAASIVTGEGKEALQYNGMVDAFRKTVRHEGFGALYKGLVPNSVKVVPSIAIAFVTYEAVKDVLGVEMRID